MVVVNQCCFHSPILLISVSEVVHIAASFRILCVHVFAFARLRSADQLARVLHHELTAAERASCYHAAPLAIEIFYLESTQLIVTIILRI